HRTLVVTHGDAVTIETRAGTRGTVHSGTGVRFDAVRIGVPRTDLAVLTAWENGRTDARGQPLADVIETLRPYYAGALRVSVAAGGLPVSGTFPLDDVDATLRALEDTMPIRVQRITPWFVSLGVAST